MRPPLDDGVVLITGASSGIGMEMARHLAPRAKALGLVARREGNLRDLQVELEGKHPGLRVAVLPTDLAVRAELEGLPDRAMAALGPVDVLINNAGFGDFGRYHLRDWDLTRRMIDLNVTALAFLTHRFSGPMVARGRGGILNVSSGFGLQFMGGFAAYVGTKHFVTGLTECLRLELRPLGIVVTQVCPGPVATEFHDRIGPRPGGDAPRGLYMAAATCARMALQGFEKDRALVVPGLAMRVGLGLAGLIPRWVRRPVLALPARKLPR